MWRDELGSWFASKDSFSLPDLFHNLKYGGHPYLWPLILYSISRFTDQPIAMQFIHLIIATGAVYIFVKFSPFTRFQKLLFIFGYFPFFEYGVISRNYSLGVLFAFCFCAMFHPGRDKNLVPLSFILFLLCQTNIYGVIMAVTFGCMILFEVSIDRDLRRSLFQRKWEVIISIFIFVVGVLISVYQMIPPPDSGFASGWHFLFKIRSLDRVISTIWRTYVPIPAIEYNFWNTNIIKPLVFQWIFSLILLSFFLLLFVRRPVILFLYFLGTIGMLSFMYVKYLGYLRHFGYLFVLLIVCLWLSDYYTNINIKERNISGISNFCSKYSSGVITVILFLHLIAGIGAGVMDFIYPFSESKETAKFIKDNKLDDMIIVGDVDYSVAAVAGHLNRKIHYPRSGRSGTFIIWDKKRERIPGIQRILKDARRLAAEHKKGVLIILNGKIREDKYPVIKIAEFNKSIEPQENFYLYLLKSRKDY